MDNKRKDNMTDLAGGLQKPASTSPSSSSSNTPSLAPNQVVGTNGTVIDLGIKRPPKRK